MKPTTCILVAAVAIYAAVEILWNSAQPLVELVLPPASSATAKTPPVDPPTLDRAARAFRVQLYETFRHQPDEIERRQAAWREVLGAWQAAGARPEDAARVVAWLEEAIAASRTDAVGAVPPVPVFEATGAAE